MPDYRSPGVYVEEVPGAVQPIAGVGTSTAGFIGIVPDTVVVPWPNPHHNPTQAESAVSEITASVENLLGKTLAQDIGLTTQVTLLAGTVLDDSQARDVKAAGGSVDVTYVQAVSGALLGKRLAENVTDSHGNVISVPIDGTVRELRAGYTFVQGEVTPIRAALTQASISQLKLRETMDLTATTVAGLLGKTLAQDVTVTSTLAAGTVVADKSLAERSAQAIGAGKVKVLNSSVLSINFSPPTTGEPRLCTNFGEFKRAFGDFSTDVGQKHLAHAVYGFFNNGGTRCYVVRMKEPPSLAACWRSSPPSTRLPWWPRLA